MCNGGHGLAQPAHFGHRRERLEIFEVECGY